MSPKTVAAGKASTEAASHPATFLAVSHDDQQRQRLELRSSADGRLLKIIDQPPDGQSVTAARVSGDEVIVARSTRCRATLERVNTDTGRRVPIRTLNHLVSGLTLSPDGRTVAFITMPFSCTDPSFRPGTTNPSGGSSAGSAGVAQFNPSVLAVTALAGGPVLTAPTDGPGHPLGPIAWSPDGSRIAASYLGNRAQVVIFSATRPDFRATSRIPAPRGCVYFSPIWTRRGIVVAQGCGRDPSLSPGKLVRVMPDGAITAKWALPDCIIGVGGSVDASYEHVLVSMGVGYGMGPPCDKEWVDRTAWLSTGGLHTVLDVPNHFGSVGLGVADW